MITIIGRAKTDGGVEMTEYQKATFRQFMKDNAGSRIRLQIDRQTPESRGQRKFLHGAVIPLWAYLDGKEYRDNALLDTLYEIAKVEFNGEWITVAGKAHRVGKSTKGELHRGFMNKIIDFLEEQYGIDRSNVLNPDDYKNWRDKIFPFGGPETYIGYLVSLNKI